MLRPLRPSAAELRALLERLASAPFSYANPGMSRGDAPRGFWSNHARARVGAGDEAFARARAVVRAWGMFALDWIELHGADDRPPAPGLVVLTLTRAALLWTANACRVVYVDDDADRYQFAYGTLPGHAVTGEERFTLTRARDGAVWFEILSYSRPAALPAQLAAPLTRRFQRRFVVEGCARVAEAVADAGARASS
ncbi:MAG: DUF1990 domain-containing protein [Myxococcales bacterium]|nr:DUF1990 domain-containing protein [Myxococcales bacterium]